MTLEELQARIAVLEDIEAIKKLQAKYLYMVDAGDWQGLVNLFTEEPVLDLGSFGIYKGKEELAKFYRELPQSLPLMVHMGHNPVIEVNGGKATGEWYYEVPATDAATNRALWIVGKFEVQFVKVGEGWKYKTFTAKCIFNTPYDEGWVKTNLC